MPAAPRRRRPPARAGRRRRAAGLIGLGLAAAIAWLILRATLLAPVDTHGLEIGSVAFRAKGVPGIQRVGVIAPPRRRPGSPLLVFLHGKDETISVYTEDEALLAALARLGPRAPIMAIPEGTADSYWHDRASGAWGSYVLDSVIPQVARRYGVDPHRVAIGGISMGGFGAYDLALRHPGRFCAVGGHSPALFLAAADTAAGAFDSAEDFERNDVVAMAGRGGDPFGGIPVWNDAGSEDPFRSGDLAFDAAARAAGARLTSRTWPGRHERSYWDAHWRSYLRFYARALARCG